MNARQRRKQRRLSTPSARAAAQRKRDRLHRRIMLSVMKKAQIITKANGWEREFPFLDRLPIKSWKDLFDEE